MPNDKKPLCRNCCHFSGFIHQECQRVVLKENLVTGYPAYRPADRERQDTFGACGPTGKQFKPRPAPIWRRLANLFKRGTQ